MPLRALRPPHLAYHAVGAETRARGVSTFTFSLFQRQHPFEGHTRPVRGLLIDAHLIDNFIFE